MDNSEIQYRTSSGREVSIPDVEKKIKQQLRSAIRRIWSRYSHDKGFALRLARVETTAYKKDGSQAKKPSIGYMCAECRNLWNIKDVQVDHLDPVGSTPENINDWGPWITRLFCSFYRLQVLCLTCHKIKTKAERGNKIVRKIRRHTKNSKTGSNQSFKMARIDLEI